MNTKIESKETSLKTWLLGTPLPGGGRAEGSLERAGFKSLERLAQSMLTSRSTLYYWLNGQKTPTLKHLERMCKALKVELSDILPFVKPVAGNGRRLEL